MVIYLHDILRMHGTMNIKLVISHAVTEYDKQSNGSAVGQFSGSWSVSQKIGESAFQRHINNKSIRRKSTGEPSHFSES